MSIKMSIDNIMFAATMAALSKATPTSVHDPKKEYTFGSTAHLEGSLEIYIAIKEVPKNSDILISNSEYWSLYQRMETHEFFGTTTQNFTNVAEPMSTSKLNKLMWDSWKHDPNAAVPKGQMSKIGEHHPETFVAIQDVPANKNISIYDRNYWSPMVYAQPNYFVGCAAVIFVENTERIVLLERLDPDRPGHYILSLPGGKPETNETMAQGISREICEEVGVLIEPERYKKLMTTESENGGIKFLTVWHSVVITRQEAAVLKNMEPHKHKSMQIMNVKEARYTNLWQEAHAAIGAAIVAEDHLEPGEEPEWG